jgi:hypothetical protein
MHSQREGLSNSFANGSLDRLVGVTRQADPHLAELRHLGNVGLVNVLRLDLKHLRSRLSTYQPLKCAGRILNRILGLIGDLGGNSLKALVRLAIGAEDRIGSFIHQS